MHFVAALAQERVQLLRLRVLISAAVPIGDQTKHKGAVRQIRRLRNIFIRRVGQHPFAIHKFKDAHHFPGFFLAEYFHFQKIARFHIGIIFIHRLTDRKLSHVTRFDPAAFNQNRFDQLAVRGRRENIQVLEHVAIFVQQFAAHKLPALDARYALHLRHHLLHLAQAIRRVEIQRHIRHKITADGTDVIVQGDAHVEDRDEDRAAHRQRKQRQDETAAPSEGVTQRDDERTRDVDAAPRQRDRRPRLDPLPARDAARTPFEAASFVPGRFAADGFQHGDARAVNDRDESRDQGDEDPHQGLDEKRRGDDAIAEQVEVHLVGDEGGQSVRALSAERNRDRERQYAERQNQRQVHDQHLAVAPADEFDDADVAHVLLQKRGQRVGDQRTRKEDDENAERHQDAEDGIDCRCQRMQVRLREARADDVRAALFEIRFQVRAEIADVFDIVAALGGGDVGAVVILRLPQKLQGALCDVRERRGEKITRAHGCILRHTDEGHGFDRAVGQLEFQRPADFGVDVIQRAEFENHFAFARPGFPFERGQQVDLVVLEIVERHHIERSPFGRAWHAHTDAEHAPRLGLIHATGIPNRLQHLVVEVGHPQFDVGRHVGRVTGAHVIGNDLVRARDHANGKHTHRDGQYHHRRAGFVIEQVGNYFTPSWSHSLIVS